jgi:serine/threonine protein kinase
MVSEWMDNGTIDKCLKANQGVDVLELVRVPITTERITPDSNTVKVREVAYGLEYLHSCDAIHSDLKSVCISPDILS